jgi:hypothetical protein
MLGAVPKYILELSSVRGVQSTFITLPLRPVQERPHQRRSGVCRRAGTDKERVFSEGMLKSF